MAASVVAGATDRVRLARLALGTALALPGVAGPNAGPDGRYVTQDHDELLRGVTAAAESGGRYSVGLYLTAGLVPLYPLADEVRERVGAAAAEAGLGDRLGRVTVHVLDVWHPLLEEPT